MNGTQQTGAGLKCAQCSRTISSASYINGLPCCDWCLPQQYGGKGTAGGQMVVPDYSMALSIIQNQLKEIKDLLMDIKNNK